MKKEKLRHVVLFSFKKRIEEIQLQEIIRSFEALEQRIEFVKSIEWGVNESPEGLNKGFTHCFIVTFDSDISRNAYLTHPNHLSFVDLVTNHLEDVCVVDFWIS
ncbi:MAG: Dabb family protein [Clostridia bacterium]|nr:Dabb family protein [Clostridia bacterium]